MSEFASFASAASPHGAFRGHRLGALQAHAKTRVVVVVFLWWCLCGGVFVVVEVVFLWWCLCGGVFVMVVVFLWWCFCGDVFVVVFL